MSAVISQIIAQHQAALEGFFYTYADEWTALAARTISTFQGGGKLLFCGNGGSACDAMHIAGEFCGRYVRERRGLPAIALSADAGILTAVGNDYGFERIFARQVEALGKPGDILIAMSTSGSSPNVLEALHEAERQGIYRILLTGEKGRDKAALADALFVVPSSVTARIQEVHMVALHLLAELVDEHLCEEAA